MHALALMDRSRRARRHALATALGLTALAGGVAVLVSLPALAGAAAGALVLLLTTAVAAAGLAGATRPLDVPEA